MNCFCLYKLVNPYNLLVERIEGYSGSDIRLLSKEAAMQPLRRLIVLLEGRQEVVPEDGMTFQTILIVLTSSICLVS